MKHYASRSQHCPTRFSQRPCRVAPAFTLVEMLVVITIMTILLTVGSMGLKNMSKASGVSAGLPTSEALFAEARALAMGKGTRARVLIHAQNEPTDKYHRERYLRYMAIEYVVDDNDTADEADDVWELASKGISLPKGVYFLKIQSEMDAPLLETPEIVTLPGKSESSCYYYTFNAEGMIVDPEPDGNSVPRFVIASGSLPPGAEEPIISGKNIGGFVIWRNGRTSLFRHPDQIDPSL